MLTAAIEAYERLEVATFDLPGAFLHADSYKEITMLFKGRVAELMALIEPKLYRKYVFTNSKGESML